MGLSFVGIKSGAGIYVDANIHLYSAFKHPVYGASCRDLLIRIDEGDVYGYTSDFVLDEVLHKLMIAEVAKNYTKSAREAIVYIKKNPEVISQLEVVWAERDLLEHSHLVVLENRSLFPDFVKISKSYNLMVTDAVHVAIMSRHGLTNIATNDPDFERVAGLTVWKP
ncbi:MAG: type II toxin-antitoxin system VapC family toxin [Methanomicrobia archaeon]|nr:type II toxin-antitoxin system VapC family toxin [Methanomicrobia archaeon]